MLTCFNHAVIPQSYVHTLLASVRKSLYTASMGSQPPYPCHLHAAHPMVAKHHRFCIRVQILVNGGGPIAGLTQREQLEVWQLGCVVLPLLPNIYELHLFTLQVHRSHCDTLARDSIMA